MSNAFLRIVAGPDIGFEVELARGRCTIGRHDDCDLVLGSATASKHHAIVKRDGEAWELADLNSSNGTWVNGVRVTGSVTLAAGDVIAIGECRLQFGVRPEAASGAETPERGPEAAVPAPVPAPTAEERVDPAAVRPRAGAARTLSVPRAPGPADGAAGPGPAGAAAPPSAPVAELLSADEADVALVRDMQTRAETIRAEIAKVIIGQREVVDQVLTCLIAGGHALLIGVPGTAKTTLVRTVAQVLDLRFRRVQFTPDLMPSDIIGTEVLETDRETDSKGFRFLPGPVFCHVLLADEINRTPPKTQAALLEAMQEKSVTVGKTTYPLEEPFLVLATQNPIEQEGTYPLPEAQLDRFMFSVLLTYPHEDEEEEILRATTAVRDARPACVVSRADILRLQNVVRRVPVSPHVVKYALHLVRASRPEDPKAPDFVREYVSTGAGTRAGQYLILAAKARAVLEGRLHVSCRDVAQAARPVLGHRILTNFAADSEGLKSGDLVERLLKAVPEPAEGG